VHSDRHRRTGRLIGASLAAAALTTTAWLPGSAAASTGWQVAFRAHTGASTIFNGLIGVSASGKASAWAVGGTDLSHAAGGAPAAERWNGKTWHAATLPSGLTGATWQQVTSTALNGLQFGSNVWVTATVGGSLPEHLLHFNGKAWTRQPAPSGIQLRSIAPGGHGGLWFSAERLKSTQPPLAEHRSATGTWSSHALPTGAGQAFGIAAIPGTTSLWASGYLETGGGTGSDAVIWGHGPAA